jgi:superfamily II DNA or RNA helicase
MCRSIEGAKSPVVSQIAPGVLIDMRRAVIHNQMNSLGSGITPRDLPQGPKKMVMIVFIQTACPHRSTIGDRFGFLILDEVHHLTSPQWVEIARLAIAPCRLGLTATYDPHSPIRLGELVGPLVYWKPVRELSGTRLAPYEVIRLAVDLSPEEYLAYELEEKTYLSYWQEQSDLRSASSRLDSRLEILLREQTRDERARRAFQAWQQTRRIIDGADAKLDMLEELFRRHASDRTIVFAATNEMAYKISQIFLIPTITHQTNARERKTILKRFEDGEYMAVATSRVLNEGVDVPEAMVAIILGGSPREHTQRLGRILRQRTNKLAVLYEITVRGTIETSISWRRRQTEAYPGRTQKISRL